MKVIKKYTEVNHSDLKASFGMSKMEDIYDKRQGKSDEPHRHDFYTILLVKKGKGKHIIDFNEYEMADNQVYFIGPGQVHQIIEQERSLGYSMVFSANFLADNNIPPAFIENVNLFQDYGQAPPLEPDLEMMTKLTSYCEEINYYYLSDGHYNQRAIGALIEVFLICCNNVCDLPSDNTQIIESGNSILRNFKLLVEQHFRSWHSTSHYAEELNITADHLNRSIKSMIGKTAKGYILTRIVIAAKRLLLFSDFSTKEIGYELGFAEPANFSAFFKKNAGMSPSQFKLTHS